MAHPLGGPELSAKPLAEHGLGEKYAGSRHVGTLPMGCIQCREGAKLVLFITGLCDKECFYCPVSRDKMYRDVMFANERAIHLGDWDAVVDECNLIGAKGAGITGGDPMVVPARVEESLRVLKARFGPSFHTHLYTSCSFDLAWIARLKAAGLDEMRFHPEVRDYARMESSWHHAAIREAVRVGLTVTIEIPCIPGKADEILALAHYLEKVGAHGLNLNELEFSEPNIANLKRFGYQPANDETQSVAGSRDTALDVLARWKAAGSRFTVHFCSSPYKDAIQLMQRLRRRAERTMRPFDEQGEEGTLLFGVMRPRDGRPGELAERLRAEYEVPAEWVVVQGPHVETAPWVAEELAAEPGLLERLGCEAWLSEVYPTADRLEVERTPLPLVDRGAEAA
ncbi:MAG TPA: radical SAM protein [Candidatus Thermoplasmatota archaeon]|nr:radical SAM protein [Candidatus Thermoplasmatota archaeon]